MRIVVAGATGALGKQLVPRLVRARTRGHRHDAHAGQDRICCAGSARRRPLPTRWIPRPLRDVVGQAQPDAIIHELTALSSLGMMRNLDRAFAQTNRLRTEATDHLLAAGRAVGVQAIHRAELRRLAGHAQRWPGEDRGRSVRHRSAGRRCARRWPRSAISRRRSSAPQWTVGIALRYGGFYGPGTSLDSRAASTSS